MKVDSYSLDMSAQSQKVSITRVEEDIRFSKPGQIRNLQEGVVLSLSKEGYGHMMEEIGAQEEEKEYFFELSDEDKTRIRLVESLMTFLTGKKVKINLPEKIEKPKNMKQLQVKDINIVRFNGFGLDYRYKKVEYEKEEMSFKSTGTVKTGDGRVIDFKIGLDLSREVLITESTKIKLGQLVDPLVINYDTPSAEFSDDEFEFDLNLDGVKDNMPFLKKGSGFLVLDKNNDGQINDGSEMFGPSSGDGFSELKDYDSDGNGWIDENDKVFDKLKLWIKNEDGTDKLLAIAEANVGAIFLGNVAADFSLNDSNNEVDGVIRQNGIFLKESGEAGIIQHVDIVI